MQQPRQRISVIGTTGSGKTTLARQISSLLKVPHVELDALYWERDWTGAADEVFRDRVARAIKTGQWVVDGNYSAVRSLVWARATTVVYLDYGFWRVFYQLMRRTLRRSLRREELWNGNREELAKTFFSRDSILWWMLRTYHRRRKKYAQLFRQPDYAHLEVVHLKTPQMTEEWLSSLQTTGKREPPGKSL